MTDYRFETHSPVELYVEIGRGRVDVQCTDTTESTVSVEGRDADEVRVEQDGNRIDVIAPRHRGGFSFGDSSLTVCVVVPTSSDVSGKTGSADVTVAGTAGTAAIRSGSGEVRMDAAATALVETGSGDVRIDDVHDELKIKSGSGDIVVGQVGAEAAISTGSGDVQIGSARGGAVVKTGSGDLRVMETSSDLVMKTGSGDFVVDQARGGRLSSKGASGDVRIGVPAGVPVWTDISTVSGRIRSTLTGAGQPVEGQPHVELRATTVSGDIVLTELN